MNWMSALAVAVGAVLGSWLRWVLGLWLNPLFPTMPLGTLTANLVGGYLIGVAVGVFHVNVDVAPEVRFFIVTGFLGGLTTFSSFSAEVTALLRTAQYGWAAGAIGLHLGGSLVLTWLGILTVMRLSA